MIYSKCILIDDSKADLFLSKLLIKKHAPEPIEITDFLNGQDALRFFEAKPELKDTIVLLDINMPVMNGFELLEELKNIQIDDSVSFLMVSSSNNPNDIEQAKKYSLVKQYITKPLDKDKIEEIFTYKKGA